jgi:hypothetical protein
MFCRYLRFRSLVSNTSHWPSIIASIRKKRPQNRLIVRGLWHPPMAFKQAII